MEEKYQGQTHAGQWRWEPHEISASKEILKKYLGLLSRAGIELDSKTVAEWLSLAPSEKDMIKIGMAEFVEAVTNATYDAQRAKDFQNNPPELSFKMKIFLEDVNRIRRKPKHASVTHAHLINSLRLEGPTIAARVKALKEKHQAVLQAIDSEGMACLVLGKILGYDWEINVNNAELMGILQDARNELKYSTVPRELLALYDQILMQSGISKNGLIKYFGLDPKDIK
jgi:hypothetical protein